MIIGRDFRSASEVLREAARKDGWQKAAGAAQAISRARVLIVLSNDAGG
jgi:Arc/MetJ-type ribon-helix-helix transcriptional regulator